MAPPPTVAAQPAAATSGMTNVHVYFDGSGSIAGYFAAPHTGNIYRTLVMNLGRYIGPFAKVDYNRFGKQIAPIKGDPASAADPNFYTGTCLNAPGGCDNQVSLIGHALDVAEKQPSGDLSLIFTDLFLTNGDLDASGPNSMLAPLREILTGGRSIGILGIKTVFDGKIFDMPGHPPSYSYAHRPAPGHVRTRPIFMIMIGQQADILKLYSTIKDVLLPAPLVADQDYGFTVFANSPAAPEGDTADEPAPRLAMPDHASGVLKVRGADASLLPSDVPAFKVHTGQKPVALPLDVDALGKKLAPAGFALGGFVIQEQVWDGLPGPKCVIWKKHEDGAPKLSKLVDNGSGGENVELFSPSAGPVPGSALSGMAPGYSYFVKLSVVPRKLVTADRANWLNAWSLTPDAVDATIAKQPDFFPALNLDTISGLLQRIVEESFKVNLGHPIAETQIILNLEK